MLFGGLFKAKFVVGKDIKEEDISDFYFTNSGATYPPFFTRYHLHAQDNTYTFNYEKREGNSWPLREKDISASFEKTLSKQEWENFYEILSGGIVKKRTESVDCGGRGPYLFLYWKGDKAEYQEYSFENIEKQGEFEKLCERYTE